MENSTNSSKWYNKTWLVILLVIIFFPVGLYALWMSERIGKGWKIAVTILIGLALIGKVTGGNEDGSDSSRAQSPATGNQSTQSESTAKKIGVGDVLHTQYFDVTVNKVNVSDQVNTGNEFADLKRESGNQYLIMNVSFKNTDNESRTLFDGTLWINYQGKDYQFDKSEMVMLEGWGLFLDQINPLTTKTTNLVYKIPTEIKGEAYWQPGRADSDEKIYLGNI